MITRSPKKAVATAKAPSSPKAKRVAKPVVKRKAASPAAGKSATSLPRVKPAAKHATMTAEKPVPILVGGVRVWLQPPAVKVSAKKLRVIQAIVTKALAS